MVSLPAPALAPALAPVLVPPSCGSTCADGRGVAAVGVAPSGRITGAWCLPAEVPAAVSGCLVGLSLSPELENIMGVFSTSGVAALGLRPRRGCGVDHTTVAAVALPVLLPLLLPRSSLALAVLVILIALVVLVVPVVLVVVVTLRVLLMPSTLCLLSVAANLEVAGDVASVAAVPAPARGER